MKEEMLQEFKVMNTLVEDTRETNPRERDSRNFKEVPKFSGNIGENLDDWKRVDPRDNRSKTIKCYKCGRSGHVIKDCRVRKGGAVHKVNQLIADEKIERVLTVTKKDMPSILGTEGYVNEIKLKVWFDSGATASIIAHDVAERITSKFFRLKLR
jgi:hypothetical protein